MSKALVNGVEIYYELDGSGEETVVFLNGIMMSTVSWADSASFYLNAGYRLLRLDFRDQGRSGRSPEDYGIEQHVEDLKGLFDLLGLKHVHLVGISYGGQVAMLFALKYGYLLQSLVLANTTARLTRHLRAIGSAWEEAARLGDAGKFFRLAMPFIHSSSFYEARHHWINEREELFRRSLDKEWFEGFLRLIRSHGSSFDLLDRLKEIRVPTLVLGAERDVVTPLEELRMLHERIEGSLFIVIPDAGHGSLYEKAREFHTAILGFLSVLKTSQASMEMSG
ncbi:alpha/beta fold hydrolase [Desulfovirgula thermocuniculi]|uniref:alpha/beta fold hydrolase n=1 Tax=Desulfovirgula thermocuniculi TaxID=348842 RepID=UPI000404588A|nr:alpha/beta hydrolase [Desulfovirgula thermocuniculi]